MEVHDPSVRNPRRIRLKIDGDRQKGGASHTGPENLGRQHGARFAQDDEQNKRQGPHHRKGRPEQGGGEENKKDRGEPAATQMQGEQRSEPPSWERMIWNPEYLGDKAGILKERVPSFGMEKQPGGAMKQEPANAIEAAEQNDDSKKGARAPLKGVRYQIERATHQTGVLQQHHGMGGAKPGEAPKSPR